MAAHPLTDLEFDTLTPDIVEKAIGLEVATLPKRGAYVVTGGSRAHYVSLCDPEQDMCDCSDHLWRSRLCKHITAVLVAIGDFQMWRRLQEMAKQ